MILFIFFLSFLFGAYIKVLPLIMPIVCILWFIFLSKRYGKNITIVCSLLACLGTGLGYINYLFDVIPGTSYTGFVIDSKTNYFLFTSSGQRFYVYNKNNTYEIGDCLKINGEKEQLSFSFVESQFDFKDYLNKKGVIKELRVSTIETKFKNPIRINEFRRKYLSHFNEETSLFIGSFLFKYNNDNELREYGENLHIGRFFSLSGIYIYTFLKIFDYLFSLFFKRKISKILSIISLSLLFIVTIPNFPLIRILFISLLSYINEFFLKKKYSSLFILSFTGIIFTIFDFYIIYSDSFILGFLIPIIFKIASKINRTTNWRFRKLFTSLLVYLFFIPFEIKYYNSINPFTFIYQIIFTPLFLFASFFTLLSLYGLPIYSAVNGIVGRLSKIIKFFSSFTFEIYAKPFGSYGILLMILLFILLLYYLNIRFKPFLKPIYGIFIFIYLINFIPFDNFFTQEVTFINVGQGDCCLIRNKTSTILIDTGGSKYIDIAKDCLIPYFKKRRIYNIDLIITTHDDYDHSGALNGLKEHFIVKKIENNYQNFPIKIGNINLYNYNTFISNSSEENDNSLVIGFNLCNKDFLITGDAPIKIENMIMSTYSNIPCDILKVGHHGSNTSTSDAFVKYLKPQEAIISVGRNNYGHPKDSVLDILKNNNIKIKRTDMLGTISYKHFSLF